ncbi:MAG: S8 family serine peptidase, partial [bacterium]|nr:S8 family serine peptidase [bacterium]
MWISLLLLAVLTQGMGLSAQPFTRQGEEAPELIVLLASGAGAPAPEQVVADAFEKRRLPAGLDAGNPVSARFLITDRTSGPALKARLADPMRPQALLQRYVVLSYPPGTDLAAVEEALRDSPQVLHVGPNRRIGLSAVPNDTFYPLQWGLPALDLPQAWDSQKGHAYVGVVDIGIDPDHPDLIDFDAAGTWKGGNYRPFLSYDYGNGDSNPDTGEPQIVDGQLVTPVIAGHGTHVAGIVGAHTDNNAGVAGVCQPCSLPMSQFPLLLPAG